VKRTLQILVLAVFIFSIEIKAQTTPVVFIENITAPAIGQQISIPIKIKNINNVGSVSLKFTFDTNVLEFTSFSGNPSSGTFVTNSSLLSLGGIHDTVSIAWFDLTPLDYSNEGVFVYVNFTYKGGNSDFSFIPDPTSSISDGDAKKINDLAFINGNITPQVLADGNLSGIVFVDSNKNGINDDSLGLQYVTVNLYKMENGYGTWISYQLTDENGIYNFTGLQPGNYYTDFVLNEENNVYTFTVKGAGTESAKDSDVFAIDDTTGISDTSAVLSGDNSGSWDAGVYLKNPAVPLGSIGDYVWNDQNGNGFQDPGEQPMPNIKVYLLNGNDNSIIDSAATDNNGDYLFSGLPIGNYKIQFIVPNGYELSRKNNGGSASLYGDSDPDSLTGITDTIMVVSGYLHRYDIDAGIHLDFGNITSIDDFTSAPKSFNLAQNYPNPFNPTTVIQFTLAKSENVRIAVFNSIGQLVAILVNGEVGAGTHSITFDASNLASGIYFYKLISNSVNITKKMVLMK